MHIFQQIWAVTKSNLSSVRSRFGSSVVVVGSVAGVVAVLISVLAMSQSLSETLASTGRSDRAIVVAKGAFAEGVSVIARDIADQLLNANGVKKSAAGKPIGSMEFLTQIRVPANDGVLKGIALRGVGPLAGELRPEVHIESGRMFNPGLRELVVGQNVYQEYRKLGVGNHLKIQGSDWAIVGIFSSGGRSAHDSEIFGDANTLLSAYHHSTYQSVTLQLNSANSLSGIKSLLAANPVWPVEAHTEAEFYSHQSQTMVSSLRAIAYFVGVVMAIGSIFAALNTMYASVSSKSVEVATLRAIGFNGAAVILAVFAEALILAFGGAIIGVVLAWLLFSGYTVSMGNASHSQLVFAVTITPGLAMLGIAWSLVIGFVGGLFPAIRAARSPIIEALRAT